MTSYSLVDTLQSERGRFNDHVVELTIPYAIICKL